MNGRWRALLLAGLMTVSLCACRGGEVERETQAPSPEPTQAPMPEPVVETEKTPMEAYQEALWRLLEEHIDIDGSQISDDGWDFIQDVAFAVQDVDLDGGQELLVRCYRRTSVYGYNIESGELVEELWGTESCRFYDNGLVRTDSSHNQGRGGRFWPYTVSKYNTQTGKYDDIASLDAWDFTLVPDPEYQKKVGAQGDEFIYYYTALGDPLDGAAREKRTMTQAEYDTWYQDTFGGAEEIEVDYQPLTRENINNGCARAAYEGFLAGDMSLLEPEPGWAEHMALLFKIGMEYTYLDLDGDGVDELLLQYPNDPMAYNGVFHYKDGTLQCWQHDEVEMVCRDYPLRDGTMVHHYRESYHLFHYQPDGSRKELTSLAAIPRSPDEDVYFYEVDGKDVDQAEFERQLKQLVTDQLLEREAWRPVSTQQENGK